jgi:hypothetical protein
VKFFYTPALNDNAVAKAEKRWSDAALLTRGDIFARSLKKAYFGSNSSFFKNA